MVTGDGVPTSVTAHQFIGFLIETQTQTNTRTKTYIKESATNLSTVKGSVVVSVTSLLAGEVKDSLGF
jgi:hypothetical protein